MGMTLLLYMHVIIRTSQEAHVRTSTALRRQLFLYLELNESLPETTTLNSPPPTTSSAVFAMNPFHAEHHSLFDLVSNLSLQKQCI